MSCPMRVFVTGVAGFIGSHVAEAWLERGAEVAGCDNLLGGDLENVVPGVDFHKVDCNDVEGLKACLKRGTDLVYHCAAVAHKGLSVFSPHIVTMHTVAATAGILSASAAAGVRRFVNCSSASRYGQREELCTEDMAPSPVEPYGIDKVAAEMLVRNICDTHGMEWVIAVPHNVIGPRQCYIDPYRNVAAIFINRMLRGERPYIYGDGSNRHHFSFIEDVVDPLVAMGTMACASEIINIGPDEGEITVRELAQELAHILRVECEPIYVPDRPCEVTRMACSADKARRMLGYSPKTALRDGLTRMAEWIAAKGPKPFRYHMPIEIPRGAPKTWSERTI
jgi:UDP-glucose 4-epimerase